MNVLEKATHELNHAIRHCLEALNDDRPNDAITELQKAKQYVDEVGSVVLELEKRATSLSRIIPEVTQLIQESKYQEARTYMDEVMEALQGKD